MSNETTSLIQNGQEENESKPELSWSEKLMASHPEEHNEITTASFLLRDAIILSKATSLFSHTDYLISTNPITKSGDSDNKYSKFSRQLLTQRVVTGILTLCVIGLVTISFLEPPVWCRDFINDGDSNSTEGGEGCKAALYMQGEPAFYVDDSEDRTQYYYPSTRTDYLTAKQALTLECLFMLFIIFHTALCIVKDGFSVQKYLMLNFDGENVDKLTSNTMKNIRIFRIIRFLSTFFLAWGLIVHILFSSLESRPFAIFLRILLFISYSEGVQRELMIAVELIPSLTGAAIVLFMVIGFYGLIGVAAFYDTLEGELHFSNWVEGIWSLWTSMTTVIYPDVMMAGYNENRFVALFFVTFMIFTFFFLQNVILAIVANGYNASTDKREEEIALTRKMYVMRAYDLLTGKSGLDHVTYDQLMAVFLILNEDCDEIERVSDQEADMLFAILDQDGTKQLEIVEFMNFTTVMLLQFEEVCPTWLEKMIPYVTQSQTYHDAKHLVESTTFDYAIDLVVFLNALVVIAQSYPELAGHSVESNPKLSDGMIDTPWEVAETLFTFIYVVEMLSKILLLGWKKYSSSVRNWFDGFITVMSVGAMLLVYIPNGYGNSHLIRFVVMARVIRVFRLFMVIKPFQDMSNTFLGVLPAAGRVALLLFCVVYTFSAIGMHIFGGRLTRDPNNQLSANLEDTDYANNFYWANNFNDLLSGMNVCFNLLVINNWNEMETGLIAITSKYCRYFLFAFYVCGVLIVNNLVVGIVIDFFCNELDAAREAKNEVKEANGGMKKLQHGGKSLFFDSEKLPEGNYNTKYVAKMPSGLTAAQQKIIMSQLIP